MSISNFLLVEDDVYWQKIISKKINLALQEINHTDYKIHVTDNFNEAFIALKESSWNLLITDIGLGITQQEEAQKLGKELVEVAHMEKIPTIVVTGTSHLNPPEVRDLLKILGAYDFFFKENFDSQNFIKNVQEILQKNNLE